MNRSSRPERRRQRRLFGGALLACLWLGAVQAQEPTRVAYVDMQRLLDSAPQVAEARDRLARGFAVRDKLLKDDEARLRQMEARLREQAALLSADEAAQLAQETDALRRSVERTRTRLREELGSGVQGEVDRAWPAINEVVAEYARDHGYDLVVSSPVIYVSGRIDITDRVLDRLRELAATEQQP